MHLGHKTDRRERPSIFSMLFAGINLLLLCWATYLLMEVIQILAIMPKNQSHFTLICCGAVCVLVIMSLIRSQVRVLFFRPPMG